MITQEEIAKQLNLSRTTVARALAGNASIKPETRDKVIALATKLGYQKNLIGSSLASKTPKKIYAFLIESINENYCLEMTNGLTKARNEFKNYNFSLEIVKTDINSPDEQIKLLQKIIKQDAADGIIIIPQHKEQVKKLIQQNSSIQFMTLDIPISQDIPHIGSNYVKSGKMTANILSPLLRGHEKVLILDTESDNISSKQYLEGFCNGAKASNILTEGPIYFEHILQNIDILIDKYLTDNVKAIYSSRYLAEIVTAINKQNKKHPDINLYIISNGMSANIKQLIKEGQILATIKEDHAQQSYLAAKHLFLALHGERLDINHNVLVKSEIIYKENLN
ncbi:MULTISPECIES: LacI family DNA-binding transcriptional regulator [Cysteiniphilum]|uniref:LacI family DNA-binding transcriptional regulator n=1 Tax=Cysteiniphilum TaxID=2056696 RepID=UPI001782DAA3|nr:MULTISPECIES: LacI family DNA-binding transcriptional regulator [Cysteiniphilum]